MKIKVFFTLIIFTLITASGFTVAGPGNGNEKEKGVSIILHQPQNKEENPSPVLNPEEFMTVPDTAVPGHVGHGDCVVDDLDGSIIFNKFDLTWYCMINE